MTVSDIDLFWAEKGRHQTILCIHGFSSCFYTWRNLFSELTDEFHIVAIDLPGFGFSGNDPSGIYDLSFFSSVLVNFCKELKLDQVILCGHSFGGLVCQDFANRNKDLVKALILISSPTFGAKIPQRNVDQKLMLNSYTDLSTLGDDVFDVYRAAKVRTPSALSGLTLYPSSQSLTTNNRIPCLVIWGKIDKIIPVSYADDILAYYPKVKTVLLETQGHCPHEEHPQQFLNNMQEFLLNLQRREKSESNTEVFKY